MQSNETKSTKKIEKVLSAFNNLEKLPKALIKYGSYIFFGLFIIGTVLVLLNNTILPYNSYFDMVSKELVKKSFVVGAEVIIGGLVMDFAMKK